MRSSMRTRQIERAPVHTHEEIRTELKQSVLVIVLTVVALLTASLLGFAIS